MDVLALGLPPLAAIILGALSVMLGAVLLVGSMVLSRPDEPTMLPSMINQAIPPMYDAVQDTERR